jgi:hypothetical protein
MSRGSSRLKGLEELDASSIDDLPPESRFRKLCPRLSFCLEGGLLEPLTEDAGDESLCRWI